ncbi:hypothetical protein AURDEDRAFT_154469 [Auricularia subglabra TFB-10046 SS5]|uniref:F-box domain-containing protein n=1 Tax=Auricularia subglabra (strain TFB-10046 / SS5) TaxID=717982 RepID=J0WTW5_AURST|nr:hypothetical protein AURDEDRAFT_154469 [Auricularia subglabra TFB-10046 SS5]
MSSASLTVFRYSSPSHPTRSLSSLLQLPDELLHLILTFLPFRRMVQISHVCSRLRSVAEAHSILWQELPAVSVSKLHILKHFAPRSGRLGLDLMIHDIGLGDLSDLCQFLDAHYARVRALRLSFADLPDRHLLDDTALQVLHKTLSHPAPLLEILGLEGDFYEPFLGSLQPNILGGAAAPKLKELSLTAFALDRPYPGFQCVETVITTVGALSPQALASNNFRVHAQFPAIQHLELSGIEAERDIITGIGALHALSRVPCIDQPLPSLMLSWYQSAIMGDAEDVRASAWLESSLRHVQQAHVTSLQCSLVSETVLDSTLDNARVLRITPKGTRKVEVALWSCDPETLRTAVLTSRQARAQVDALLRRADYLHLDTLTISTSPACISLLKGSAGAWNALAGFRTLSLVVDWQFVDSDGCFVSLQTLESISPLNSIRTLHVQAPADLQSTRRSRRAVDADCLVLFVSSLLPKVEKVILRLPEIQLMNPELLADYPGCHFSYLLSN